MFSLSLFQLKPYVLHLKLFRNLEINSSSTKVYRGTLSKIHKGARQKSQCSWGLWGRRCMVAVACREYGNIFSTGYTGITGIQLKRCYSIYRDYLPLMHAS